MYTQVPSLPPVSYGCGGDIQCNPVDFNFGRHPLYIAGQEPSNFIWEEGKKENDFLMLFQNSKEFFPDGVGDVATFLIGSVEYPTLTQARNWQKLRESGYDGVDNPCCFEYIEISSGYRTIKACLQKIGFKTPRWCKLDLAMKPWGEQQVSQLFRRLPEWSACVFSDFVQVNYHKNVYCHLALDGMPSLFGQYPKHYPNSQINMSYLTHLENDLHNARYFVNSITPQQYLVIIGDDEFQSLRDEWDSRESCKFGVRYPGGREFTEMYLPGYNGRYYKFGQWLFFVIRNPLRYRERTGSESWDDCIVDYQISVKGEHGVDSKINPLYNDRSYAKYVETLIFHPDAIKVWLPSKKMTSAWNIPGGRQFPATDLSGIFQFVPLPCDDDGLFMEMRAKYVLGMSEWNRGLGRAILSLGTPRCLRIQKTECESCPVEQCIKYSVTCCNELSDGTVFIRYDGGLPDSCPEGYSWFLETHKGNFYRVTEFIEPTARAACKTQPAGTEAKVILSPNHPGKCGCCGKDCDPYKWITCRRASEVICASETPECCACGTPPAPDPEDCVLEAMFFSDSVTGFLNLVSANVLPSNSYNIETANATAVLQTDLQNYLTANGGGTAAVTLDLEEALWTITITGNPGVKDFHIGYLDPNPNQIPFTQTDCA